LYETASNVGATKQEKYWADELPLSSSAVILTPWIEREYYLTYTAPLTARPLPVIARLDWANQKLTQYASWIIRSSRMMTPIGL